MHYPSEVTRIDGTISLITYWDDYAFAPDVMYGSAEGAMWSDFWVSFLVIFFKVLSLMYLTLLLLDFKIVETILLGELRHVRPCEKCV
jgi:hypothetical protein